MCMEQIDVTHGTLTLCRKPGLAAGVLFLCTGARLKGNFAAGCYGADAKLSTLSCRAISKF
jgi:hypothetical protein